MTTAKKKNVSSKSTGHSAKGKKPVPTDGFVARHRLALIIVVSIVVAMTVGLAFFAFPTFKGPETIVVIPRGSSDDAVADTLESRLGSSFGKRVYMLWKMQGGNPTRAHGRYSFGHGTTALRISRRLATGRQTPVRVSFIGVRNFDKLAERLTRNLEMGSDDFLKACETVLGENGFRPEEYPAAFLPDTYEFYWDVEPETMVQRLLDERNRFWNDKRKEAAKREGLTPVQVATLASIVEEESAKSDERPVIARLYLNRFHKGMKLQADPTVKFALNDPSIRRITHSMLSTASPYNTYLHEGLPPGPIRVPERATLEAVLNAPANDYLYMCAKEDFSGYHNFTADYQEHQRNAARYQQELNRRGIK